MRNRGRNYSRKRDRVYPGYSVRTKSGGWKTIYRYKKASSGRKKKSYSSYSKYSRRRSYKPRIETYGVPNSLIIGAAVVLLIISAVYFLVSSPG